MPPSIRIPITDSDLNPAWLVGWTESIADVVAEMTKHKPESENIKNI